jgi:hypothetical protein
MDAALHNYLKPETIERQRVLAQSNRATRAYLLTLRLSALVLQHAQSLSEATHNEIDRYAQRQHKSLSAPFQTVSTASMQPWKR